MRTPEEAIEVILNAIEPLAAVESIPLAEAAGRVLAHAVISDVNLPPFEKSMMDGFALRAAESRAGDWDLEVIGESRAGAGFAGAVGPGQAVEIYTGAELPPGVDAVQMIEKTRVEAGRLHSTGLVPVANHVSHLGEILAEGRAVLAVGHRISAVDLTLLAAVGADPIRVFKRPRISILTTGDELVPASQVPGPGQIREGNTMFLAAAAKAAGCELLEVGVVPDDRNKLEAAFERALSAGDALITTGGVSMGRYDLVGPVLESLGVEPILHKVAIKPGKPIWFGMYGSKPVLGLPGNPVSSLLGYQVFVAPVLELLSGCAARPAALSKGRWVGPGRRAADRQLNLPVAAHLAADGVMELSPSIWKGSADIAGLAAAHGFGVIPAGGEVAPGDLIEWRPFSAQAGGAL